MGGIVKRLWLVAGCVLAVCVPAGSVARPVGRPVPAGCHRVFWLGEGIRFTRRVFAGSGRVGPHERSRVRARVVCQRTEHGRRWLHGFVARQARAHAARVAHARWEAAHPFSEATASWYDDSGTTASGWHASYGFADCGSGGGPCYPFGTRVEFCFHGCVVATADDHGPYVAGRAFDLGASTAQAIGFSGVDDVYWRLR